MISETQLAKFLKDVGLGDMSLGVEYALACGQHDHIGFPEFRAYYKSVKAIKKRVKAHQRSRRRNSADSGAVRHYGRYYFATAPTAPRTHRARARPKRRTRSLSPVNTATLANPQQLVLPLRPVPPGMMAKLPAVGRTAERVATEKFDCAARARAYRKRLGTGV